MPIPSRTSAEKAKIVLAEKDLSDLEHIGSILENIGFKVFPAQDGRTALGQVRFHQPSLVIASLDLPELDGYKLSQRIREDPLTEGIPFMFIMSSGEFPDRLVGHQTYANDYIQKPVSVPEFKSRVTSLLRQERKNSKVGPSIGVDSNTSGRCRMARNLNSTRGESYSDGESVKILFREAQVLLGKLVDCFGRLGPELTSYDKMLSEDLVCAKRVKNLAGELDSRRPTKVNNRSEPEIVEDLEPMKEHVEDPEPGATEKTADQLDSTSPADKDALIETYLLEFRRRRQRREPVEVVNDLDEIFAAFLGPQKNRSKQRTEEFAGPISEVDSESQSTGEIQVTDAASTSKDSRERDPSEALESAMTGPLGAPSEEVAALPEDVFFDPGLLDRFLSEKELTQARGELEAPQDSLYERAKEYVLRSILGAAEEELPSLDEGFEIVDGFIRSIEKDRSLLLEATDRLQEFSLIGHSVNVSAVSIHLARTLGRSHRFQERIGLAALLHEIGVIALPPNLIFRKDKLSSKELTELRRRPFYSGKVLEKLSEPHNELAEVVSQVYERDNGAGYPRGLKEGRIREEARILGIADVFDACIHQRPYKNPLTGYQTLYELSTDPTGTFSDELVKLLIRSFSLFPLNERLCLNNGMTVRVVDLDESDLARPVVEVLYYADGNRAEAGELIPLADDRSLKVVEVINPLKSRSNSI